VLRARRVDDERLRERMDRESGLDEDRAQPVPERRSARFAGDDDFDPTRGQPLCKRRKERRFAAPFDTLDCNELPRSGYADAPVPYGKSLLRKNRTRRFGSMPVLRDMTRCCSASWCCMRRTYDVCGVSSTGLLSSNTL